MVSTKIFILILITVLVIALIFLILALIEPHKLEVNRQSLGADKEDADLRLFFFSDLHAEFCFIKAERVVEEIKKANEEKKLDAVIFGGDVINFPHFINIGQNYLQKIKDACNDLNIPFYGVTGNHDYKLTSKQDKSLPFKLIEGKHVILNSQIDGTKIAISGVNDSGRKERVWYDIPSIPKNTKNVLIAHNPDVIMNLNKGAKVDYMLSGHIHGGQIRTPFGIEFTVLRKDILPKKGYISGTYDYEGTPIFISKGIGCVSLPLRLGATPEVTVVEIKLA